MRKEIENWWKQAKRDLITAEHCKDSGDYYACAFFCQQSIEKGLKALFLLKNKTNPGKSHSLIYLATETETPAIYDSFLRKLAPEFVTTRYPDATYGTPYELYNEEMVTEILEKSKEVMSWIDSQMKR